MRLITSSVGLAAATLLSCINSVASTPNYEVATTTVEIDRHKEKLDNGELIVNIQRTQDLFSDATAGSEAHLLLERDTHLLLRIQLDADKGTVNVNDAPLDLNAAKTEPVTVTGIKADTYRLPPGQEQTISTPQELEGLVDQMSRGLVKVEVKIESEPISPSIPVVHTESNKNAKGEKGNVVHEPTIGAMSIRKVGLWLRITEVEGKTMPHTTAIYTPILQLIVTGSEEKVEKISTLAIGGKAPLEGSAHHMPGPVMVKSLPPVEGGPRRAGRPFGGPGGRPGHHHGSKDRESGIFGWIARTLDLSRWARPSGAGQARPRRPCHGRKMGFGTKVPGGKHTPEDASNTETAEGKVVGHRPMLDNPFSGTMDDVEEDEEHPHGHHHHAPGSVGDRIRGGVKLPGRPPRINEYERGHGHGYAHMHRHHAHGKNKCGRFLRNMALGVVYGLAALGNVLLHPVTVLVLSCLLTVATALHVIEGFVRRRAAAANGQLHLGDDCTEGHNSGKFDSDGKYSFNGSDSGSSDATEPLLMGEKEKEANMLQEVVVDEQAETLPRYEDRS